MKINVKHQYKDQIWYEVEDVPSPAVKTRDGHYQDDNGRSPHKGDSLQVGHLRRPRLPDQG